MHPEQFEHFLARALFAAAERSRIDLTGKQDVLVAAAKAGAALHKTTKGDDQTAIIIATELFLPFLKEYPPQEKSHPDILCTPFWKVANSAPTVNEMLHVWENRYSGHPMLEHLRDVARKGAQKAGSSHQGYKGDHAHYHYLPGGIAKLFETKVYWFDERTRHAHHWIVGNPGTGKTNLIKWWLEHDLVQAADGKCSVMVIDNKVLISQLRQYRIFAPGERLAGKLKIIDTRESIPLNPFYIPGIGLDVAVYMLEALAQGHDAQEDTFYWLARAASQSSEKNFRTVRDLLDLAGQKTKPMPKDYDDFDEETARWFDTTFHELNVLSLRSMRRKMANLFKNQTLIDMFNADSFAVNLGKIKPGDVVFIDTNKRVFGDEGSEVLGRLFIKLLDELSDFRTKPGSKRWPIYVYIDEAASYVRYDRNFISLLDRAREQQISVTTSNQADDTSQVTENVRAALKRCNIQTRCIRFEKSPGEFETLAHARPPIHFHTNILYKDTIMSDREYETMRAHMKGDAEKSAGKAPEKKVDSPNPDDRTIV